MIGPYQIETKLGNVWANVTDIGHAYLDFGHNLNVETEGPGDMDRRGPLTVRGIVYAGSIHVYRYTDGSWNIGQEFSSRNKGELATSWDRRSSLYMQKYQPSDWRKSDASESARNVVAETVLAAFRVWAESHADVFVFAGRKHREAEKRKRLDAIKELEKQIDALHAEIKALSKEEN